MNEKKSKKPKKEKPIYIDDGSTVADMSGLEQTKSPYSLRQQPKRRRTAPTREPGRAKAILQTYWQSVKLMLVPMLVVIAAICLIFLILWFLF